MTKVYVEMSESLVWALEMEVPDNIAFDPVSLRDYIYENWGEHDKDFRSESEPEIVTLQLHY